MRLNAEHLLSIDSAARSRPSRKAAVRRHSTASITSVDFTRTVAAVPSASPSSSTASLVMEAVMICPRVEAHLDGGHDAADVHLGHGAGELVTCGQTHDEALLVVNSRFLPRRGRAFWDADDAGSALILPATVDD